MQNPVIKGSLEMRGVQRKIRTLRHRTKEKMKASKSNPPAPGMKRSSKPSLRSNQAEKAQRAQRVPDPLSGVKIRPQNAQKVQKVQKVQSVRRPVAMSQRTRIISLRAAS
jgi:hypothetical protein